MPSMHLSFTTTHRRATIYEPLNLYSVQCTIELKQPHNAFVKSTNAVPAPPKPFCNARARPSAEAPKFYAITPPPEC